MVTTIKCKCSNNIMKANYTDLADGQNISISQNIKLIATDSKGGILYNDIISNINTNLTKTQLNNFNLTFSILYYNSSIKPGDLFPHKVYLYGIKKIVRNLEENNYNSEILFPSCITGDYSEEDSNAIGSIKCNLPDFIPAGTYSKIKSDGFDVSPNIKINLVFQNDFNKNNTNSINELNYKSSSSSSKTWIIWLVAGIILVILVGIVIVACIANRKKNNDDNSENNSSMSKPYPIDTTKASIDNSKNKDSDI